MLALCPPSSKCVPGANAARVKMAGNEMATLTHMLIAGESVLSTRHSPTYESTLGPTVTFTYIVEWYIIKKVYCLLDIYSPFNTSFIYTQCWSSESMSSLQRFQRLFSTFMNHLYIACW